MWPVNASWTYQSPSLAGHARDLGDRPSEWTQARQWFAGCGGVTGEQIPLARTVGFTRVALRVLGARVSGDGVQEHGRPAVPLQARAVA
ncbi:hypothetical protein ACFQ07_30570, partial [Actinomadura adrarensis]